MHAYVHTYIRTYVHTYVRTYVHTYIRRYVHTYIHTKSPLGFPLGNGGPGPHHFTEIWIHRFSMLEQFHSIEEMLWIFDRISGKQGVPFYRDCVNQQRSPQNFHLPFYRQKLCFSRKQQIPFYRVHWFNDIKGIQGPCTEVLHFIE